MDADLRPDVTASAGRHSHHLAPHVLEQAGDSVEGEVSLIIERHDEVGRGKRAQERLEGDPCAPPGVVVALHVATIEALAGDAVGLRGVVADERLPDVVVGEIRMLVVRRIDVGDVDGREAGRELVGVGTQRESDAWKPDGQFQFEAVE